MEPQPGLQEAKLGTVMVLVGADWVTNQTTLWVWSLVRTAVNCCCSLVGTVAVVGVRLTPIPESKTIFTFPVFLVSCWDWAVSTICRPGNLVWSGTLLGAV